eukprot:8416144-Lingulodinium_polyedra.AAC.1
MRPAGLKLEPVKLLVKAVPAQAKGGAPVVWPATNFAIVAQASYRELFGERCLAGRKLAPQTMEQQA